MSRWTLVTIKSARLASVNDRICFVCARPIPEREGLYCAWLRILIHSEGDCHAIVKALERNYSRSGRGRIRPRDQLLRMLFAIRRIGETS